jgi:small subunit ribosomal protein S1
VGSEVSGTVARKSRYGYFVDLDQGVTALLVFGNISKEKKDTLKEGDVITVTVESVDTENRRISLSYGVTETVNNNKEVSEYLNSQEKVLQEKKASTEFGSALLAALKGKK